MVHSVILVKYIATQTKPLSLLFSWFVLRRAARGRTCRTGFRHPELLRRVRAAGGRAGWRIHGRRHSGFTSQAEEARPVAGVAADLLAGPHHVREITL